MASQLWLLRGRCCEATGSREQAADAYRKALSLDAFCYEAFELLVERNLFVEKEKEKETLIFEAEESKEKEAEAAERKMGEVALQRTRDLLEAIPMEEGCPWVRTLYACKVWQCGEGRGGEALDMPPLPAAFRGNSLVVAAKAERAFYADQHQEAYELAKQVIEGDPHHSPAAVAVYVSCLVELERANELYYCAHKLVQGSPGQAVAWYAVGAYYHLVGRFHHARRYFNRAVEVDASFGPTWIGFGHSFSSQGEPDQALAAYYSASRIMPASHVPLLYIAMEYRRLANHRLATTFLHRSAALCATDPLLWSEHGVNAYLEEDYHAAIRHFEHCLTLLHTTTTTTNHQNNHQASSWEPVLFNLAHCHRKLGHHLHARDYYRQCIAIQQKATTYTALGFVEHLLGRLDLAIDNYHHALSMASGDTIANGLLDRAIKESLRLSR